MLQLVEAGRLDADLQRPVLEPLDDLADAARHAGAAARPACRASASRASGSSRRSTSLQHHLERVLLAAARSGRAPGRARARSSPPARASCRRARSSSAAGSRARSAMRCRSASASPARMPDERPPVVARQLAAELVHEGRLVRARVVSESPRIRSATSSARFCAIASSSSAERAPRVVVEAPEQAEVEQREPPVGREQDVPAVRVGVVDALDRHLADVRAEELARELGGALRRRGRARPRPSRRSIRSSTSTRSVT